LYTTNNLISFSFLFFTLSFSMQRFAMGYADHLVRRVLEHPRTFNILKRAAPESVDVEVPKVAIGIIVATVLALFLLTGAVSSPSLVPPYRSEYTDTHQIEYGLEDVIATLAIVETPNAAITVSPSTDADEPASKEQKEPLLESAPTFTLVHKKPITSSIRGTIRHLRAQAGRRSYFRGFWMFFFYNIGLGIVSGLVRIVVPQMPGDRILIAGISTALFATVHATWTHKVISMPSQAPYWTRHVPVSNWKFLALPAAIKASAFHMCIYLAWAFAVLVGLDSDVTSNATEWDGGMWLSVIMKIVALCGISVGCALFIVLPAHVTLIRMEASVLPEDQDTIVPFDRTFADKVVPKSLGGTGVIGFLDAWRSFNWEARVRVVKLYAKIMLIETFLSFVVIHVIGFEIWALMGAAIVSIYAQSQGSLSA
jgi:hypothetical protein